LLNVNSLPSRSFWHISHALLFLHSLTVHTGAANLGGHETERIGVRIGARVVRQCRRMEARLTAHERVWGAAAAHHSGLLRFSVKEENMMLKLMLILSSSLALASTECCK